MHSYEALQILLGKMYNYITKPLVLQSDADAAENDKSILAEGFQNCLFLRVYEGL